MSKKNARSWKLMITSTVVMVAAGILVLNVGASANVTGTGPVPEVAQAPQAPPAMQQSTSPSRSPSPSQSSEFPPECVPMVTCEEESPAPSTSPSTSTSPEPPGGDKHSAKVTIDYSNRKDSFVGKVDSKAICEKARRIDLFEVAPGKDQNLGHALTNNKGKYRIPYPNANGRFYTKARKAELERRTTCKGATSKTISV